MSLELIFVVCDNARLVVLVPGLARVVEFVEIENQGNKILKIIKGSPLRVMMAAPASSLLKMASINNSRSIIQLG